jgi:hypothetical protein
MTLLTKENVLKSKKLAAKGDDEATGIIDEDLSIRIRNAHLR